MQKNTAVLLLLATPLRAEFVTQTDWSGGPGVPGPSGVWGSSFLRAGGIDWYSDTGQICLQPGNYSIIEGYAEPAEGICAADIDGDGDQDVIRHSANTIVWYENPGQAEPFWTGHFIATTASSDGCMTSADIDSNGSPDIIEASGGKIWIYTNFDQGASFQKSSISVSADGLPDTGDIDGDGDIDVAGVEHDSGDVFWCENLNGAGTSWGVEVIHDYAYHDPTCACVVDLDCDGCMDVAVSLVWSGKIHWYRNAEGTGRVWEQNLVDEDMFISVYWLDAADIDDDGDPDLLGTSSIGNEAVGLCRNLDGQGTSWSDTVILGGLHGRCASFADIDGDGDLDVCYDLQWGDNDSVEWAENLDGSGYTWERHIVTQPFDDPECLFCLDLDGDAENDELVVSSSGSGGLRWWTLDMFSTAPEILESSILYLVDDPEWAAVSWSSDTPPGTAATFQVRASDDFSDMGDWSDTIASPCGLSGILSDSDSYLQYRVILETEDAFLTPVLSDVTFSWNSLSVEDERVPADIELRALSNPSAGFPSISFGLPRDMEASLAIYDLAGRVVSREEPSYFNAGWHTVRLGELAPGVYFARLEAGETQAVLQFVVLE